MSIIVIAEHNNQILKPATLNAIAAACQITGDIHVLVAGFDCETVVENYDFMDGCSMSDLIDQCAENAEETIFAHGRFVSCVAHLTNEWRKEGLIDFKEKAAIQRCAARSNLPGIRLNLD